MKPRDALGAAIFRGQIAIVTDLCRDHPELAQETEATDVEPLIQEAAATGNVHIVRILLENGFKIDALRLPEKSTALVTAIGHDHDEVVDLLLRHGANTNLGRPLISALNQRKAPERRLKYVSWLVEHGAEVNRLYDLYGDSNNQFTALDWTDDPAVIAFLRSRGAKTSVELKAERGQATTAKSTTPADEVVRYFEDNFGKVDKRSLVEIVPTGYPIAIHAIRPAGDRKHLTLFTTGLSERPMNTPSGQEEYSLAELFVQLPGDEKSGNSWIIGWLRKIAQYPHDNNTWLGGPLTIIDNEDPPQPLSAKVKFTSWLLVAEKSFQRSDGRTVQLYRITPIYLDERNLERQKGAPALMRAFDRASVPFIVDLDRPSVAKRAGR